LGLSGQLTMRYWDDVGNIEDKSSAFSPLGGKLYSNKTLKFLARDAG